MSAVSDGERAAASGLQSQYGVGAVQILKALRHHNLEWIRVADPAAGRVDDFQIARTARLDAYQVKWQQYAGTFTLRNLVRATGTAPNLMAQLADGWSRLRAEHPHRRIVVHLTTDAFPSTSTGILPTTQATPTPYHLAAFIEQAWKPAKHTGCLGYEGAWGAVWRELQEATGFDEEVFLGFAHDCVLEFKTPPPLKDEDHRALVDFLLETAAGPERIVQLDRFELLDRLGWLHRYEYRNLHEFDVPRFYRPITSTVRDLRQRLRELPGGYICAIGPPGSGKSTLLTRTLMSLSIRLVRYYAYVPEAQDPTILRGESVNFLHDITLRLEEGGFGRGRRRPDSADRSALLESLYEQLQALGADYEVNDRKTVILVDGLDHIAREQTPERSLLADFPLPAQIPKGVYIVLGTQTSQLDDLPPLIRREMGLPERRVEMGRLSPADVGAIAADVVPELDEVRRRRLFDLSAGHPLALIYIFKRLQVAEDQEARVAILAEAVSYSDDIDAYYWSHWDRIKDDEALTHLLGLLARVRGAIGMDWVAGGIERPVALKLERLFRPYFEVDEAKRWSFFHNSFRLFLRERTAQPVLGQSPKEHERAIHAELAERYAAANNPWRWKTLYHLYRAGDHPGVVAVATADWFRDQARALRPLEAIQADVRLAVRSAGIVKDPLALVRLTLSAAALEQQRFTLEDYSIADLLLDLGDIPQALELIRDGNVLRVGEVHALDLSVRLAEIGMLREGVRLFELAEPCDLISGRPISAGDARDTQTLLHAWARAAPRFRAPADVLSAIERLAVVPGPHTRKSSEDATVDLQRALGIRAAVACAKQRAWSDWDEYVGWLDARTQDGGLFETRLRSAKIVQDTDTERARKLLRELLDLYKPTTLNVGSPRNFEARLDVAELVLFLESDEKVVADWISDLPPLPLQRGISQRSRFRLCRLRYWLGETRDPDRLVAEDRASTTWESYIDEDERTALGQLAFMVTTLASLWGRGRRGQRLSRGSFLREARWVLDLLRSSGHSEVVEFLVQSAAEQGEEVLEALSAELARRWIAGEWYVALQRVAVIALARVGAKRHARELFILLEEELLGEGGPRYRAEEHLEQAKAWLEFRDTQAARNELRRMVIGSRGLLEEDDYQSEVWVRWMGRVNSQDPENTEKRITKMLRRLISVSGDASGIGDAAKELVATTFRWSPRRAVHLMKGLQEKEVLGHDMALSSLLRTALQVTDPPVNAVLRALTNLMIPLAGPRAPGLVEALIEAAAARYGENTAVSSARYLVERVRSEAISSDRKRWLSRIARGLGQISVPFERVEIEAEEIESREHRAQSSVDRKTLHLTDGTTMTLTEACKAVHTTEDLLRLFEAEDSERTSDFLWTAVAESVANTVTSAQDLLTLADAVESKLAGPECVNGLLRLTDRARKIGQLDIAKSLAARAIAQSQPFGWDRRWDGGSRIESLRALQEIDPEGGRVEAMRLYAEDVGGIPRFPIRRFLVLFDEILPLIFSEIPVLELWEILEDYLEELYDAESVEPVPEIERSFSEPPGKAANDSAAQGVADAITSYLDHPSYVVAARAVSASMAVLRTDSEGREMRIALANAIARSEAAAERVLVVLEAAAADKPKSLQSFRESLHNLMESPNLAMRSETAKLVALLDETPVAVPLIQREIPRIYTLELPVRSLYRTEEISDGEGPVALNDPARALSPLDIEIREIARIAGVDEDALLYRTAVFFERFAREHVWITDCDQIDERRMIRFLRKADLRVSFQKPHIEPTSRAIAHAAAELWDGGLLNASTVQQIVFMLRHHDPTLILVDPQPRPGWLPTTGSLPDDDWIPTVPEEWVERAEESVAYLRPRTTDGRIILGELSRFAYLGTDKRIEEDRMSHTVAWSENRLWEKDADKQFFYVLPKLPARAYARARAPREHLVIFSYALLEYHTSAAHWIAFNPRIAREFGWRLSSEGLFRWIDEGGDLAVESMWWRDGSLDRYDRHHSCSVGEGWLVLATESAYSRLIRWTPRLSRGGLVCRRKGHHGSEGSGYSRTVLRLP